MEKIIDELGSLSQGSELDDELTGSVTDYSSDGSFQANWRLISSVEEYINSENEVDAKVYFINGPHDIPSSLS